MLKKTLTSLTLVVLSHLSYAQDNHIYQLDHVKWQPSGLKGAEMAILWGDESKGNAVWAFRLQPGVAIPPHIHSKDYWGFAVQGQWGHIDSRGKMVKTGQNAYVHITAHELHADKCLGPTACINIIQFAGSRDIIFPKSTK